VVNERTAERFAEQETFLVDQVQGLSVDDAKTSLDYWRRLADTDGPDPDDPTRNWARVAVGYEGRWRIEADLDPVGGAVLRAVLEAIVDRMHQDGRFSDLGSDNTHGRRTADAFVEMAHRASGEEPRSAGRPPRHRGRGPCHSPRRRRTRPVRPADARRRRSRHRPRRPAPRPPGNRLSDDLDDQGRPLHLGRKQRLASSDQWIALTIRDRGCDEPARLIGVNWPGGFHHLYAKLAAAFGPGGLPDFEAMARAASEHGAEILGPPLAVIEAQAR